MAQIDLAQAQHYLRSQANSPAKRLRRQIAGAAILLLLSGGYAALHASAKSAPEPVAAITAPR